MVIKMMEYNEIKIKNGKGTCGCEMPMKWEF